MDQTLVDPLNVRHVDPEYRIDELMESLTKHGQLQPVLVYYSKEERKYMVMVGQRRFLAAQRLGWTDILAMVYPEESAKQTLLLSLAENLQRVDLNRTDQIENITRLYLEFYGKDEKALAVDLGLHLRTVRDLINIGEFAPPAALEKLERGQVKRSDIKRAIEASDGDKTKTDELLDVISQMSTYEKNRAVDYAKKNPKASVNEIKEEGVKGKVEKTIILQLTKEIKIALEKAAGQMDMDESSLAYMVVVDWLLENRFL